MRFVIPEETVRQLGQVAWTRRSDDDVVRENDAFLIDPGLGPPTYLTRDGRVLLDGRYWDDTDLHEADDDEAVAAIVVGAKKTGVRDLLSLLPSAPPLSTPCEVCKGSRWVRIGVDVGTGAPGQIVCYGCRGRGWTVDPSAV
jgi:hypothetical protein